MNRLRHLPTLILEIPSRLGTLKLFRPSAETSTIRHRRAGA